MIALGIPLRMIKKVRNVNLLLVINKFILVQHGIPRLMCYVFKKLRKIARQKVFFLASGKPS